MTNFKTLTDTLTVSGQLSPTDIATLAQQGVTTLICNRPDGEGSDQVNFDEIEQAATAAGLHCHYQPVISGKVTDEQAAAFGALITGPGKAHAYCRSGMRSTTLWALSQSSILPINDIVSIAKQAGFDMTGIAARIAGLSDIDDAHQLGQYDVVIVGGGAAGIATAASIKARCEEVKVVIIDPADVHYYQPGWTFVGAGIFSPAQTAKTMASLIPRGVDWIKAAVAAFDPARNTVILEGCRLLRYQRLVVAPGLKLNWDGIEGLSDTLGRNSVTSNYRFDLAPYTWELVQNLRRGTALFTQPPMPIKCAGAPQKAMYLSADYWHRQQHLAQIQVGFYTAGPALFGVADYVPALMKYVDKYQAELNFSHKLVKVDGSTKTAWFETGTADGQTTIVAREFDLLHVCPPQIAPDFIRNSPLADSAGWVDVDQNTLRHKQFDNIWSLGDVMNAPNAKTAAAARKQAPVVANNLLADMGKLRGIAHYDGYGSCPLTVERGKIVLAEFGYGGKLLPSMPTWLLNGTRPSRLAWFLKERMLPPIYWKAMLRGKEWLAEPVISDAARQ
ncbi:bifunctional protein tyrosine phosphatase family protein/NAD(P)/FAD-dependent oxidoreductase [Spongiibacter taiwanensis]|uniref:bifunctional protein tyrosine phosphatase family protein/NAD(P)/FAD-dependent oxidoreductase n=1 Tax=Spongiibacter taiwanensis TaxID=1748242 RepID=UPI00203548F4|nr:bifunctional protein tyrosine phosphatase family protein/NAD(P)/FAD-dependent oxidoreductase [Spongiibacter taiwanensis]USA41854.1 bifunctional protein tyrosine phosphatase family protein/NAD(P)/FAD-dependent oxidoreductase [Spongiibacter taiwanensis]